MSATRGNGFVRAGNGLHGKAGGSLHGFAGNGLRGLAGSSLRGLAGKGSVRFVLEQQLHVSSFASNSSLGFSPHPPTPGGGPWRCKGVLRSIMSGASDQWV